MNAAFRLEFRRGRMFIFWLGLISVAYAGFITLFYPVVLENAADIEKLMAIYPKELMAAFGIVGSLSDPGTFLNSYIYQFLWPLVAAIGAILLATRPAADADRGFLDLPLSTPLPRLHYLAATVAAQLVELAIVAAATVGAIVGADLFIEPNFDTGRVLLSGVHAFCFAAAISGVTTLLAIISLDRGRAGGLVAGILIVMYLLNVLAALSPDMSGLARLTAFHYFDLQELVETGAYPLGDSLLYLAVAVVGWGLALPVFRRRDLAA
jgi:ABC-2 type transport system permease protein